ncbi:MAG: anthranilate phosphoribosyltransferase, partial [Chloroflexi bacterium]|nr:anthranilate phosphoribosyltransferase [Chloroflexota bacterium]
GVPVAKHGNRAITSRCGSADLIEALGIPLDPGPDAVAAMIRSTGFGFLFAPAYHPAMKHAMPIRRELPMRTAFNLLGPLSSPAAVRRQLIGVAEAALLPLIAGALKLLGVDRALVVHGSDGTDELSLSGASRTLLIENGDVKEVAIDAAEHGLGRASLAALRGGDAARNVDLARSVLAGEPGPPRDVVLLNAGAALFVSGRARDVGEGIGMAVRSIDSGRAAAVVSACSTS